MTDSCTRCDVGKIERTTLRRLVSKTTTDTAKGEEVVVQQKEVSPPGVVYICSHCKFEQKELVE